jgi:hypothetical protein
VVPDAAGVDKDDAFFKVSVLEEELRVMNPDMTAIQVRHCAERAQTVAVALGSIDAGWLRSSQALCLAKVDFGLGGTEHRAAREEKLPPLVGFLSLGGGGG